MKKKINKSVVPVRIETAAPVEVVVGGVNADCDGKAHHDAYHYVLR